MPFSREKRETPEFILPLLWPPNSPDLKLQEKVYKTQNTHQWSRRPQTSHQNWVGQGGSRRHCCSCASMASSSFSFSLCQGGRWSFRGSSTAFNSDSVFCDNCGLWSLRWLVESNSCRLIFRSDFLAVVSYDVRFNTLRSFNSQGKVVTLIRCGGLLLC